MRQEQPISYLNTVVTVGKVVHLLELLVNDPDARLVGAVGDLLDVLGALAHLSELLVNDLGGLDGGLRVELGYCESAICSAYQVSENQ